MLSYILLIASYIQILSNPILSYPIQQKYSYSSRKQNTMLTNDNIIYCLDHLCNKE